MATVYCSLGSNIEPRAHYLLVAVKRLSENKNIIVLKASRIYETRPWGIKDVPLFLNQCIEIATSLPPHPLLIELQAIEKELGRTQKGNYAPRTIDIDILLYNNLILETKELTIPHKHMHKRRFVLEPLLEIAPHLENPLTHTPYNKFLKWSS